MAVYEINGARYEIDDALQGDELYDTLAQLAEVEGEPSQETSSAPQEYQPFGQIKEDIDPDTLTQDQDWLAASRLVYELDNKKPFEGSDDELAEWGLDFMGWFNYNLPRMTLEAAQLSNNSSQEQKEAFLHLMDQYDETEMSWSGVGRFLKGAATDPTNLVGLGTLGIGLVGREGAKQASKMGIRELLHQGTRTGVVAGVEGAMYTGYDNTVRQGVEVTAGRKEEVDNWEVAGAAGLGAVVGFAGGTVLDAAASGIAQKFRRGTDEVPAKVAPEEAPARASEEPSASANATPEASPETPVARPEGDAPVRAEVPDEPGKDLIARAPEPERVVEGEITFQRTLADLPMPQEKNAIPFIPRTMEDVTRFAKNLGEDLRELHFTQAEDIAKELQAHRMTQAEYASFNRSTQIAVDEIRVELAEVVTHLNKQPNAEQVAELTARQQELEDLLSPVALMDEALSSLTGSALRQRQEGLTELRGLSPQKLMEEEGMTKQQADMEYATRVEKARVSKQAQAKSREFDQQINTALAKGDVQEAARLTMEKQEVLDEMGDAAAGIEEPGWTRKLVEFMISNVFSPTTLMINIVPSMAKVIYRPVAKAVLDNPFEAATRRELLASFTAMRGATRGAFKAGLSAFKYEQSILTHDPLRMLDGELAMKGRSGAAIRIFPRLLGASDEVMSRIAYEGFVAGRAAGDAYEQGVAKGLSGAELESFVKQTTESAVKESYDQADIQGQINIIARKGKNLGHKGAKLRQYVEREIQKHGASLSSGNDKEGIEFVREVLYKTPFDQAKKTRKATDNAALKTLDAYDDFFGSTGRKYEEWVNEWPVVRLFGQLFLRTPIRVFEEGMRLTPGIQIVTPGFINDLNGRSGRLAQVRAQGEAMIGLGITGLALSLYAQGKIVGDGAYEHWKQQRNRTDSDLPEPYTIQFDDGTTWNFRNFDPLATPFKIIANGMERWERLEMRRQQGEFVQKNEWDQALAAISVGTGAITTAVRDANLMAGLDAMLEWGENLADPEQSEGAHVKFIGEKLRAMVPNTLHKIARTNDPTLDDPMTFWQMLESRVLGSVPGWEKDGVPKSYDVLGNVREIGNTGALWGIFSGATPEERQKGRSETELAVLRNLDYISKQTGVTFATPTKHRLMGRTDLRKLMTSDGQETLQDRWQRYYAEMNPEDALAPIVGTDIPVGTTSINGGMVTTVNSIINSYRDAAFARLMAEESQVTDQVIQGFIRKAEVQSGFWDQ